MPQSLGEEGAPLGPGGLDMGEECRAGAPGSRIILFERKRRIQQADNALQPLVPFGLGQAVEGERRVVAFQEGVTPERPHQPVERQGVGDPRRQVTGRVVTGQESRALAEKAAGDVFRGQEGAEMEGGGVSGISSATRRKASPQVAATVRLAWLPLARLSNNWGRWARKISREPVTSRPDSAM